MAPNSYAAKPRIPLLASCLAGLLLLAACAPATGGGGAPVSQPTPAAQATQPPAQATQPTPAAAAKAGEKGPAAQVDACKLLTKAEVESAAGRPLGETVSRVDEFAEPSYASFCSYNKPGSADFSGVSSSVLVGRGAAQAKEVYQLHKNAPGITAAPAAGVGEDAFWVDSGSLTVLKGKYEVKVSIRDGGLEAVKGLASKISERLP